MGGKKGGEGGRLSLHVTLFEHLEAVDGLHGIPVDVETHLGRLEAFGESAGVGVGVASVAVGGQDRGAKVADADARVLGVSVCAGGVEEDILRLEVSG